MSDSLWPHELQHTRPPCPSPTLRLHSDSRPLSPWCHPAISSSVVPFSSCPQCLPASESFPMSQLFAWGGQSTGVSALASVLPKNTQDRSPLGWTSWISLQSKGLSRVFSTPQFKSIDSLVLSFLHSPTLTSIHDHWKSSIEERKDVVTHISLSGDQGLSPGCTTIWLFLLCFWIPSPPWLAIVWIHPLELRKGPGGWMKPISYR